MFARSVQSGPSQTIDTQELIAALASYHRLGNPNVNFDNGRQHDLIEAVRAIRQALHCVCTPDQRADLLGSCQIRYTQRLTCCASEECQVLGHNDTVRPDFYWDAIPLKFSGRQSRASSTTVKQLFRDFKKPELLDCVCTQCGCTGTTSKVDLINSPYPAVLVVEVLRFSASFSKVTTPELSTASGLWAVGQMS
eukprot:COSAG01_NODE_549_length_15608_cov_206.443355_16_plen_194_part_00